MNYTNDVCSLEQAKELKRLGVKQESAYYWEIESVDSSILFEVYLWHCSECSTHPYDKEIDLGLGYISAYNTGELIAMLPKIIGDKDKLWKKYYIDWSAEYGVMYLDVDGNTRIGGYKNDPVAKGSADVLLHLLQNELTTIEEVNRRLDEFHMVKEK